MHRLLRALTVVLLATVLAACGGAGPADPAGTAEQVSGLVASGDFAAARTLLFTATRQYPDDARLRQLLGQVELELGNLPEAEAALRKALALGLPAEAITADLARVLVAAGRPREALALVGDLQQWPAPAQLPFALVQAEAELALSSRDARRVTRLFAGVWRLRARSTDDPALAAIDGRLAALAARHAEVRYGREHASCTIGTVLPSAAAASIAAGRRVLQVGPTRALRRPSDAQRVARDGDVIDIDAGDYPRDVAVWTQSGLLLRAAGGPVRLDARGQSAAGQGIWVFRGNDIIVEGIEFRGARGPDRNAAGIRFVGRNLTVRNSRFFDNENGILTWNAPEGDILVEHSVFAGNGDGAGFAHNIYIGAVRSFTLRYSHSHDARVGHAVKSRAATNRIEYNRLTDEDNGNASYLIDLPEGGTAVVAGNVLEKGLRARNPNAISFASESKGTARPTDRLVVMNNSFYNRNPKGVFVANRSATAAVVANNLLTGGPAVLVDGPATEATNYRGASHGATNAGALDFALGAESPLVDAGTAPDELAGSPDWPAGEYVHPAGARARPRVGAIDIGAYEYCGWP